MNTRRWACHGLFAVALLVAGPDALAASCEDRLAELDRLIADNEDLSEANLQAVRMQRDLGARYCEQGNDGTANATLDVPLRNLRERAERVAAQKARSLPKSLLTPEYLQGDWCASHRARDGTLRRAGARNHFYADGSFHIGGPPTYRLDKSAGPKAHEYFVRDDYRVLIAHGPDEFRVELHGASQSIYRRGGC